MMASFLIQKSRMTGSPNQQRDMVRWQFRFRDKVVTCGVSSSGAAGFSVVTVPHHNVRRGTVEIYKDLVSALQRHASIAAQLRAEGWSIASYTT